MYLGLDLGSSRITQSSSPDYTAYFAMRDSTATRVSACLPSFRPARFGRRSFLARKAQDVVRRVDARVG